MKPVATQLAFLQSTLTTVPVLTSGADATSIILTDIDQTGKLLLTQYGDIYLIAKTIKQTRNKLLNIVESNLILPIVIRHISNLITSLRKVDNEYFPSNE